MEEMSPTVANAKMLDYGTACHIRDALNKDLMDAFAYTGGVGTRAHLGMLEMLTAVCARIEQLQASAHGPTDVLCETIEGDPNTRITLSIAVRVF